MHRFSKTATYLVAAAMLPATALQAHQGLSELARGEIARRQALVGKSDEARDAARKAYINKDHQTAVDKYKEALNFLPPGRAVADRRKFIIDSLSDASVALSKQKVSEGDNAAARALVNDVLKADPENVLAKTQSAYLDDPIRTTPGATKEHAINVDKVRRLLYTGEGFYNLGKYDDAFKTFEDVLRIDKYNQAARRWMQRVNQERSDYYASAYDETRSRFLLEVDKSWEIAPQPKVIQTSPLNTGQFETPDSGALYLNKKLKTIIIPRVDFEDADLETVIEVLRLQAREHDPEPDPSRKGLDFVIRKPSISGDVGADIDGDDVGPELKIPSLKLSNVPLGEVLNQVVALTTPRMRVKVEDFVVAIVPGSDFSATELFQRSFSVPPDFLSRLGATSTAGGTTGGFEDENPFAAGGGTEESAGAPTVRELFERSGISFPDGATATFIKSSSILVVRNTANNIDQIDIIVQRMKEEIPSQIYITTKFVEIQQQNDDELGFDWIISPFGVTSETFLGGGTSGSGQPRTAANFTGNVAGAAITGVPALGDVFNTPTGGLRSGTGAIAGDSVDALIANPDRADILSSAAPGILGLTGLFNDGQVQLILRGLAQKTGTDIMTAPSILARSGDQAIIEIVRAFIYPLEYDPPQIPNNIGTTTTDTGTTGNVTFVPITPSTPTAFEEQLLGVVLDVTPNIGDDKFTINLDFNPEIVEFEGFINYGSPIQASGTDVLGNPVTLTITENRIEQPVFSRRRVDTSLSIYDGHTVAVGGLINEQVQKVEDKVPVLGDLPLVGRLFQSQSESRIKSNLVIFVTAKIVDAAGRRINGSGVDDNSSISNSSNVATDAPATLIQPDYSGGGVGVLPGNF